MRRPASSMLRSLGVGVVLAGRKTQKTDTRCHLDRIPMNIGRSGEIYSWYGNRLSVNV